MEEKKIQFPEVREVEVKEVVIVTSCRGKGTQEDPVRLIRSVWSRDGEFIAEFDTHTDSVMLPSGKVLGGSSRLIMNLTSP